MQDSAQDLEGRGGCAEGGVVGLDLERGSEPQAGAVVTGDAKQQLRSVQLRRGQNSCMGFYPGPCSKLTSLQCCLLRPWAWL
jgi:hypothetical protein